MQTNERLATKRNVLIQDELHPESQSSRVCKPCFRRVETFQKKSFVLCSDLQEFRSKFAGNYCIASLNEIFKMKLNLLAEH